MKALQKTHFGQSRLWWLVMLVGILLMIGGISYWAWPAAGYVAAAIMLGWLLIVTGIVQIVVSTTGERPRGWGWWLASGVLNLLIGFMLVSNITLALTVFPYFMAFFFIFWGIQEFVSASIAGRRLWWLGIINGILMCIIGYYFLEGSIQSTVFMTAFLISVGFIYWGFTLTMAAYEMRPRTSPGNATAVLDQ